MAERKSKKNATPITEENLTPTVEEVAVVEEAIAETAPVVTNTEASPLDVVAPETVAEPALVTESLGDTQALGKGVMKERNIEKITKRQKVVRVLVLIVIYTFLIAVAIGVLFPFYWMIISSLKSWEEYQQTPPTFFPHKIMWSNYAQAFNTANLGTLFVNTVFVGIVSTVLSLIITVLAAFAFARLQFRGKNALFAALLATMMIPGELFTITNYGTVTQFLGWKETYTALIIPFLVSVFYVYLLRQNFMQIPDELYYAAKVDGTSDLKYLWKVMIPLALPTIISITILKMMGSWNSYIWPRLVANDDAHKLITNGLRGTSFFVINADGTINSDQVNYPVQMAAVAMVSFPLFLVFIFLRKYIMKGVSRSGLKG
ncbi:MAG: carbohydrate ABC transporter permease [Corallococcus sp.]|nr:carbohydrate ABC transporter permease [Corallococcus sp.]MCM1359621.1 carbohydrate ABC transporter permease [Corallococcus sp.]MCM1395213.1 carbohydrate ABC transporter permease [Corallococcus sp.]